MRSRIRDVGNNLREFYPFMDENCTSGWTRRIRICTCCPRVIVSRTSRCCYFKHSKIADLTFKNINLEIDRYNIDSTNGNSNEQYIQVPNYPSQCLILINNTRGHNMASNINETGVNKDYPIAGQDNDSQGFRDNFTVIKDNFVAAKSEIKTLETNTAKLNADNNFRNNIQNANL